MRETGCFHALEQLLQVVARELPLERLGDRFVVALEGLQALGEFIERGEVVRCERLALQHREADFDLVEPAGVHGAVHEQQVGVAVAQTADRAEPAMGGAIVHDPEDAARMTVRVLVHHLRDKAVERCDAGVGLAAAEESGAVDVESSEVGPSPAALVLVLDLAGLARLGGPGAMPAGARLNAGFPVGGDDEVVVSQGGALPRAVVEVQDPAGLVGEVGVAGEDPAAVLPRADGVLVEPAPDAGVAHGGGDAAGGAGFAREVPDAPAGQGAVAIRGRFASEGADLDDDLRGGRPGGARGGGVPRDRPGGARRSACATD